MLFMDDAVEGIHSITDYWHIKQIRKIFKIVGFWPAKKMGENVGRLQIIVTSYNIVLQITSFTSIALYLIGHSADASFLDVGHMYLTALLNLLSTCRAILMPLNPNYINVMSKFFYKMHLFHYKDSSDYAMKMLRRVHFICHIYSVFLLIQIAIGVILFNLQYLYSNYYEGKLKQEYLYNTTFVLAIYYAYPRDATTNRNSYLTIMIFSWYTSYVCMFIVFIVDLTLSIMVFHVWGHFKILLHYLHSFPTPKAATQLTKRYAQDMYSREELKEVFAKLKHCVDYHLLIINFVEEMSKAFGPMLFVYYIFHQVSCCLLLLELSQMTVEAVVCYGLLTFVTYQQLIQISIVFELIGTASEKIKDSVYFLPWECMDVANRKVVFIMLANSQKAVHIKAMGITNVGVTTMASIIKTSVSYFAFLRTIVE